MPVHSQRGNEELSSSDEDWALFFENMSEAECAQYLADLERQQSVNDEHIKSKESKVAELLAKQPAHEDNSKGKQPAHASARPQPAAAGSAQQEMENVPAECFVCIVEVITHFFVNRDPELWLGVHYCFAHLLLACSTAKWHAPTAIDHFKAWEKMGLTYEKNDQDNIVLKLPLDKKDIKVLEEMPRELRTFCQQLEPALNGFWALVGPELAVEHQYNPCSFWGPEWLQNKVFFHNGRNLEEENELHRTADQPRNSARFSQEVVKCLSALADLSRDYAEQKIAEAARTEVDHEEVAELRKEVAALKAIVHQLIARVDASDDVVQKCAQACAAIAPAIPPPPDYLPPELLNPLASPQAGPRLSGDSMGILQARIGFLKQHNAADASIAQLEAELCHLQEQQAMREQRKKELQEQEQKQKKADAAARKHRKAKVNQTRAQCAQRGSSSSGGSRETPKPASDSSDEEGNDQKRRKRIRPV